MNKPDVYKTPGTGPDVTYVLFGASNVEDMAGAGAIEELARSMPPAMRGGGGGGGGGGDDDAPPLAEDSAAGAQGEEGIETKDIELVMAQANVSRARAVAALRKHDSDIVNSIMELTS